MLHVLGKAEWNPTPVATSVLQLIDNAFLKVLFNIAFLLKVQCETQQKGSCIIHKTESLSHFLTIMRAPGNPVELLLGDDHLVSLYSWLQFFV